MPSLDFMHVDVFSDAPFSGNSLPVFYDSEGLGADAMLRITQELRQFETIFLKRTDEPDRVQARVFDLFEELPFAGHPILGAAAVLQHRSGSQNARIWRFDLSGRTVTVHVEPADGHVVATLNQGVPSFFGEVDDRARIAEAFSLAEGDLLQDLPLEVISTGLRYVVIPVSSSAIVKARVPADTTELMRSIGAQFSVLLDPATMEIRHWNNDGVIEDIATGSAAGTVAAYCDKHRLVETGVHTDLSQGRFTGRPSRLTVWVEPPGSEEAGQVKIAGPVAVLGEGRLYTSPAARP